ncbi:hypothetical protein V2J09_015679 [Rumex salicifolius]
MSELKYSPGTEVEVSLGDEDSSDIWYPATVIKETRNRSFVVKYKGSNEAADLTVVVDSLHIRPSPPACVNTTFQLLEKVDAFCNFVWSSGVVTKVLSEGRYIVYFKRTKKEKELRHTDLRLPMMQIHGKWVHSSQDAAVISKPQENKNINHGDSRNIRMLLEKSGVVKENKKARNGEQERVKPSGKASSDARSVSRMRSEEVTKNGPLLDETCKELKTESTPNKIQPSPDEHETHMTPTEQLDQSETLELPIAALKVNTCVAQSENGNESLANSAGPRRRPKKRGPGRPRRSESGNSESGHASEKKPVADSFLNYTQKPIVISLPCYSNSQWNKLQSPNTSKLPMPEQTEVQEEKKQLQYEVTDGSIANNVNCGNSEVEGLKKEGSVPKRKRGRPFGSLSGGKRKVDETVETPTTLGKSTRRSTRERREVYKSAIDTLKPKEKKLKPTNEILFSTQENQANLEEQAEGVITYRIREYAEPVSHDVSGNISDEDMPLSTWLGEVHSLPYTKLNSGGNASLSGKVEVKVGQISSVNCIKETIKSNNVDLAQTPQSASQQYSTSGRIDDKSMIDVIVNGLPFIKASPIWKVIESMEVFQQIPQNPHFQPLYNTKEHCREGLAICSMVTFSRLAEDVSKFQFDDPINILEDGIETLSDLERQGFSVELVRSRLIALLSIKRQHEQSYSLAKEIDEEVKERARIHQELDEIDKKMAELREKRALTVTEWQKKDTNIGGLQLRFDSVKEALEAAQVEFQMVATAPWSS